MSELLNKGHYDAACNVKLPRCCRRNGHTFSHVGGAMHCQKCGWFPPKPEPPAPRLPQRKQRHDWTVEIIVPVTGSTIRSGLLIGGKGTPTAAELAEAAAKVIDGIEADPSFEVAS